MYSESVVINNVRHTAQTSNCQRNDIIIVVNWYKKRQNLIKPISIKQLNKSKRRSYKSISKFNFKDEYIRY